MMHLHFGITYQKYANNNQNNILYPLYSTLQLILLNLIFFFSLEFDLLYTGQLSSPEVYIFVLISHLTDANV